MPVLPPAIQKGTFSLVWSLILLAAGCPSFQVRAQQASVQGSLERYEFHQIQMGTEFRLLFYSPSSELAQKARRAAFSRLEELEQILSDYRADSELTRILPRASNEPVVVSPDLFAVLAAAEEISLKTGGALDITVKPFVELWKIARLERRLPSPQELEAARKRVGYEKVLLNRRLQAVQFRVPGVKLDLGAIAKGYAADQMLEELKALGIRRALIDGGGDLRLGLAPPGQKGWKVRIKGEEKEYLLANCSVATSSGDLQYTEIDGRRYSHIIDPVTGIGLQHRSIVTVIAPTGILADGLATALSVLPIDRAMRLVDGFPEVAARILRQSEEGQQNFRSQHFPP